ncbi:MAG: CsbD family protein [Pseudomonadota bacterium]|nr:CsbD family protein [Pseudomonadota bacterium]
MDKNRVSGAGDKAKGAVKSAAGKVTGDEKLKAEGKAAKTSGKVKSAVGGAADAVRGATKPKSTKR